MFWMPKCLANYDGFIPSLANISRHSIHLEQGSLLVTAEVNPCFKKVLLTILNFFGQLLVRSD